MGGVASLRMFDWSNAETYGEIKADVTINTGSGGDGGLFIKCLVCQSKEHSVLLQNGAFCQLCACVLKQTFSLALSNSKNWLSFSFVFLFGPVVMVKISPWVLAVSSPVLFPQYTIIYRTSLFHMG